jgi:hypothetical protein
MHACASQRGTTRVSQQQHQPRCTITLPVPPRGITRTRSGPASRTLKQARSPDGYVSRLGNKYTLFTFDQSGRQNLSITWKKPAGQPPSDLREVSDLCTALWPSQGWTPPWTPRKAQLAPKPQPSVKNPGAALCYWLQGRKFVQYTASRWPRVFHRPLEQVLEWLTHGAGTIYPWAVDPTDAAPNRPKGVSAKYAFLKLLNELKPTPHRRRSAEWLTGNSLTFRDPAAPGTDSRNRARLADRF